MKGWIIWIVCGIALISLVAWRFSSKGAEEGKLKQQAGQRRGGATVEAAAVEQGSIVQTFESVGSVETPYRVLISPKLSGRIEYLEVREGDPVKPGQVLVRLDDTEVQGQVLQQKANVAEARSRLAQAQLNQTPTVVGVSSQIASQEANLASAKADNEQAQRNADSQTAAAKSQVTDQEAKVASAESQERNAQAELSRQKANLANAQARYDRVRQQFEKGYVSAQSMDDARTALDVQQGSLKVAEGQLAAARSAVKSANSQLAAAKEQAAIAARKGKADAAASDAKVKQANAALDLAKANRSIGPAYQQNIAALKADVAIAQAQQRQAQARLSDTMLKSPIEGTVTARKADIGSMASPGQAVLEVQYLDWLYVTASFPVEASAQIKEGQIAKIQFDALPDRVFSGPIANVNFAADPQTRQFSIRVRLENRDRAIRPGMFARVLVEAGQTASSAVVPREAIKNTSSGPTVFVVDADSVAHVRPVRLGASDASRVQVLEGVKPGERVIVLSYQPVQDGKKVKLGGGGSRRPSGGRSETQGGEGARAPGQSSGAANREAAAGARK